MALNFNDLLGKTDFQKLSSGINKYVVRPANAFGLSGFVFDIEGSTTHTLKSEITDHHVEDNSVIQDHIAVMPLTVELNGFVGELVDIRSKEELRDVQKVVKKLTVLNAYASNIAKGAKQIKDTLISKKGVDFSGAVEDTSNLFALIKNANPTAGKQQQAYLYFKAMQDQRILMSVQTPFEFIQNMAIETIIATQEEDTKDISGFTLMLKEIRTAKTQTVAFSKFKYQARTALQKQAKKVLGKVQGESSTFKDLVGWFVK